MGTADQKGQNVAGHQLNVAGDAAVGQIGDNIDTGGGDFVARDKIINTYVETKTIVSVESLHEVEDLDPTPGKPPYKGLAYFTEKDKDIYFGREALSDKLAERLRKSRFLAVIGASGSGKSSLLRAGVIPRLRQRNWVIHLIKPGPHPLTALANSLSQDELDPGSADKIAAAMIERPDTLRKVGDKLAARADAERLLLVVDQFEELFTQCKDPAEQIAFVNNLVDAAQGGGSTAVLLSMRADFYERVSDFATLTDLVSQQQEYVKQMAQEDLVRVIAEPARLGGWQFVGGLVEQFVVDVGREPGRLPLLSHALLETWERRRGTVMTLGGYRDAGGVEGAIAQTAEETLDRLIAENPDFENVTREVFLDLTELGEGTEDTRRIASRSDLQAGAATGDLDTVLEELVAARLITMREGEVEVAHEALIRRWPTLRDWLEDNRERLRFERQLRNDAQVWADLERDEGPLYRGAQLAWAAELVDSGEVQLTELPAEFLLVSRELAEREEREREEQRQRELENARELAAAALAREEAEIEARNAAEAQRKTEELARQQAEANASKLRRLAIFLIGVLTVAVIAALLAVNARGKATSRRMAIDARLAAEEGNSRLAVLLAIEATKRERDKAAQIWNGIYIPNTFYQEVGILVGHDNAVNSIAWHPDGERLASVSSDGTVRIWDAVAGAQLALLAGAEKSDDSLPRLAGGEYGIQSVSWHLEGERLAFASFDGTVHIWDVATGSELALITGDESAVVNVAWHPDGDRLASVHDDGTVRIWDAVTGVELVALTGHESGIQSVAWHPDGEQMAFASQDGTVRVWNSALEAELVTLTGHESGIQSVAWHPGGERLASASWDGTVRIWDVAAGAQLAVLAGRKGRVQSVAWHPDGKLLAATSADGAVHIWNIATESELDVLLIRANAANSVAWHPDGNRLASAYSDGTVRIWDAAAEPVLVDHEGTVYQVAWHPDGKRLASATEDGTVRIWDADSGMLVVDLDGHDDSVYSVAWQPDGELLASGSEDNSVRIWDAAAGFKSVVLEGHNDFVTSVAWDPVGERLASASADHTVIIWDAAEVAELAVMVGHEAIVESVAWRPDGKLLASASGDGTIRIWDTGTGEEVTILENPEGGVHFIAWHPDGKRLAAAYLDGTVRIWDTVEKVETLILEGQKEFATTSLTWRPDGDRLAAASTDGTVRIWDAAEGNNLAVLAGYEDTVYSVAWHPNGKRLATASADGTVQIRSALTTCERFLSNLTVPEWRLYVGTMRPYEPTCPNLPSPAPEAIPFSEDPFLTYERWTLDIAAVILAIGILFVLVWRTNRLAQGLTRRSRGRKPSA